MSEEKVDGKSASRLLEIEAKLSALVADLKEGKDKQTLIVQQARLLQTAHPKAYPKTAAGAYKAYQKAAELVYEGSRVPEGILLSEAEFKERWKLREQAQIMRNPYAPISVFGSAERAASIAGSGIGASGGARKKPASGRRHTVRRKTAPKRKAAARRKGK